MKHSFLLFLFIYFFFLNFVFSQDLNIKKDSVSAMLTQSFLESTNGKFDIAIKKQNHVLEWAKHHKDDSLSTRAYNITGGSFLQIGDYETAGFHFDKALEYSKKSNYIVFLPNIYNNIAQLNLAKKDTLTALKNLELALKISKENDVNEFAQLWPNINIATLYDDIKQFNKAETFYNETLRLFKPNTQHQPGIQVAAYSALGRINIRNNRNFEALSLLHIADSLAQKIDYREELINIQQLKAEAYTKTNQIDKAYQALKKQNQYLVKDLSNAEEKHTKNTELIQRVANQQKEIEIKNKLNESQQGSINKIRNISIALFISLLILGAIAYLLSQSNSKNKKLNSDLLQKNKALKEGKEKTEYASKLKANFFSTISHELRTPLYAVTGITDLLIDNNPNENQKGHLAILKSSGEYLSSLINNVLQINKFNADKIEFRNADFKLKELIKNIKQTLIFLNKENNNTIHIDIDPSIPEVLKGDSLKISQIIINILNNALKFTNEGNVWITLKNQQHIGKKIKLLLTIKDDGIGISEEKQKRIFDDFYQESIQLNRDYEGVGLGLTVVKQLLEAMGSTINVYSKPNQGTTFTFDLNLETLNEYKIKSETVLNPIDLSKTSILIVDDNKINLMITKRILEKNNVEVSTAISGFEALEITKTKEFDIILMDIHMPKMDGYETTKKIRTYNKEIPIIALTAVQIEENREKILNAGMNSIIVKPFDLNIFLKEISNFLIATSSKTKDFKK